MFTGTVLDVVDVLFSTVALTSANELIDGKEVTEALFKEPLGFSERKVHVL